MANISAQLRVATSYYKVVRALSHGGLAGGATLFDVGLTTGFGGQQQQCPPTSDTRFPTDEAAAVGAVQAGRAEQSRAGDQNERSFTLFGRSDGTYGFRGFTVGTPDSVPIRVNVIGSGHIHTAIGGNTLSRASDLGGLELGYTGDVENIGSGLRELRERGGITSAIR